MRKPFTSNRPLPILTASVASLIAFVGASQAADLFWDLNGITAGTGAAVATGTWDAATANWNPLADGTGLTGAWTVGSRAVFGAGADATGAYTVTVSGTQITSGLKFEEGTVTLSTGGTINLAGTPTIDVASGRVATIASVLSGTNGFEKTGAGTLEVSGANTFTGTTTISGGVLRYGTVTVGGTFSFGLGSAVQVKTGGTLDLASLHTATTQTMTWNVAPVTLDGGTLRFRASTGSNLHNVGAALTVAAGTSTIENNGGGFAQDINLNGKLSGSGNLNYLATTNSGSLTTTRTLTLNNTTTDFSGNWFVDYTVTATDDFVALKSNAVGALGTGSVTLDRRAQLINGVVGGLNSLSSVSVQKSTSTLDAGPGWTNNAALLTMIDGTIKVGTGTSSFGTIAVGTLSQAGGTIALDANATGNDQITLAGNYDAFGGVIALNFTDSAPRTTSPYTLVTYGGMLSGFPSVNITPTRLTPIIEVGTGTNDKVTVSFSGSVGNLIWTGATSNIWDVNGVGNFSLNGNPEVFKAFDNVTFDDSAPLALNPTINTSIVAGTVSFENGPSNSYVVSGTGGLAGATTLIKTSTGTVTLGTVNTYSGATIIDAGTLKLGVANALPSGAGKSVVTVQGTLDLNGFSNTINGLNGTGIVDNTGATAATLTVGAGDTTSTFAGVIKNTGGAVALTKTGTGTLTLSGANSYSGLTTVTAGTLRLLGSNTVTGGLTMANAGTVVRVDSPSQLPAGVLVINNSAVLQTNGLFSRSQGTGAGQLQNTAGMVGFSAVGGPLTINLGGAGANLTNTANGFNSNGLLLNDASATHSLTLVNPIAALVSNPYIIQVDATAPGVETILQGSVSSANTLAKNGPGTLVFAAANNPLNGGLTIGNQSIGGTVRIATGAGITAGAGQRLMVGYGANSATVAASGTFLMDADAGTLLFGGNSTNLANYLGVDGGAAPARTATATANINGGTLNFTGMANGAGFLYVGANSGYATGVLNINGGAVNVGTKVGLGAVSSATAGVMGTGSSSNANVGILDGTINLNSGSLTIDSTAATDADRGFLYLTNDGNTTGQAKVALNGGTLSLSRFYVGNGAGTSSKTILFNGATVQARANRTDFLNAAPNASYLVQAGTGAGGAIFDTNGFNITINGALVHDSALGATQDGGLVKSGVGRLTLAGVNTYTGPTMVSMGTLALNGSVAGRVVVYDGAALSGRGTVAGDLTLGSMGGATLETEGTLTVGGDLTVNGATGVTLTPGSYLLPDQPTTILTYASTMATPANFYLNNPSLYRNSVFNVTSTKVTIDVGAKSLTWTGANGVSWDTGATSSWKDIATQTELFYTGDTVKFDDTATAANSTVSLSGTLTPSAIIVENTAAVPYSFSSTTGGTIVGATGLLKKGNGTLTINQANSFSGGTTIAAGTVAISHAAGLGTGTVTLGDATTGDAKVSWVASGSVDPTNPIVVSAQGTGLVEIGSTGAGIVGNGTLFTGPVTLNRPTTFIATATDRTTFDGKITGNVGLLTVTGGQRVTIGNAANDFVGDILLTQSGTRLQTFTGSGAEAIPNGSSVQLDDGTFLQLAGGANTTETINGFSGSGTVTRNVSGLTTLAVGFSGADGNFSGVINNGSGTLAFSKLGAGTQILSGANIYTGATQVLGGTLLVNGSLAGGSAVTINGGTLGGIGSVGAVTLTTGTLTGGSNNLLPFSTGNLTLGGGSVFFELGAGGTSDRLDTAGTITFTGSVQLALGFSSAFADNLTFLLMNNDGTDAFNRSVGTFYVGGSPIIPDQDFLYTSGGITQGFRLSYAGGDGNDLVLTTVPEPGTALALLSGLGVLLACRRSRRG